MTIDTRTDARFLKNVNIMIEINIVEDITVRNQDEVDLNDKALEEEVLFSDKPGL